MVQAQIDPILLKIRQAAAKKLLDLWGDTVGYNGKTYRINVDGHGMPVLDANGQVQVTNTATGSTTLLPTENLVFQDPSHLTYTDAKGATHVFDPSGGGSQINPPAGGSGGVMNMIQTGTGIGGTIGQLKTGFGNKPTPTVAANPNLNAEAPNLSNAWDMNSSTRGMDNSFNQFRNNLNNLNSNYRPEFTQQQFTSRYGSVSDPAGLFASDARTYFENQTTQFNANLGRELSRLQNQQNIIKDQLSQIPTGYDDYGTLVPNSQRDYLQAQLSEVNQQFTNTFSEGLVHNPSATQEANIANARAAFGPAYDSWKEYTQLQERSNAFKNAYNDISNRAQINDQINQITGHQLGTSPLVNPSMNGNGPRITSPEFNREYERAKYEEHLTGRSDDSLTAPEREAITDRITQNRQDFLNNHKFTADDWDQARTDLINEGVDVPSVQQIAQRQYQNALKQQDIANQKFINSQVHDIKMGVAIKGAVAAGAAFGLEKSFEAMWNWDANTTGWNRVQAVAGAFASFATMAVTMHMIHGAINEMSHLLSNDIHGFTNHLANNFLTRFLTSGLGIGVLAAGLAGISYLMRNKASDEEVALTNLNETVAPSVWYDGPVMLLTGGLALAGMGVNLSPTAPLMQTMTAPQIQLDKALGSGVDNRYGTLFVQNGTGGQPTRVMYLTPGGVDSQGNIMDVVHVTTLGKGMTFGNGSGAYIPFFTKDSSGKNVPNPQATACIDFQAAMVRCSVSGKVSTMTGMQCAAQGGSCTHVPVGGS